MVGDRDGGARHGVTHFIKICGLKTVAACHAAAAAGATHGGFMFDPRSRRALSLEQAGALAALAPAALQRVAVFTDPVDALVEAAVGAIRPHMLQLHGRESPQRVAEIQRRFGLPAIKAVAIGTEDDVRTLTEWDGVATLFLLDAKPPAAQAPAVPGGHGRAFDWDLLTNLRVSTPWALAGGLTPATVAGAIARTGANGVDVSSGVENAYGEKDDSLIQAFCVAAKGAWQTRIKA